MTNQEYSNENPERVSQETDIKIDEKKNEIKKNEAREQRQLSLEKVQKRKKLLIYSVLALLFSAAMYLIFAPSKSEQEKEKIEQGLNLEIPQVTGGELVSDKEEAYKKADSEQKESERQTAIGALSDFFGGTQKANSRQDEWELVAEPDYDDSRKNTIRQSTSAYSDIQNTLDNFYEDNSQVDILQEQINELQAQLNEKDNIQKEDIEMQKQLELMEKSYEMAAKYMPQSATNNSSATSAPENSMTVNTDKEQNKQTFTVVPETRNIVSSLYRESSNEDFITEQMQERNRDFISATGSTNKIVNKNTLKVSVHETIIIKDGEAVRLRLLETARVANLLIPKNKTLTAVAKIQGNRLMLLVTSIEYQEQIVAVNLSAYDLDGQPGIFIPNSEEMNAVKEVVAGMGQSAGTSFTFNSSAGQQLAADAGKGVMQGASQYINKKMREIKLTLKSGHLLYLIPTK